MPRKDANWFSSYFGWKRADAEPHDVNDKAVDAVHANGRDAEDRPTPALKRVWRGLLGNGDSHPHVGGR